MSKWFYDTSTNIASRAARYGSLLEGLRSLEFQLWGNTVKTEDLCGSGHQSVIPYVHGRMGVVFRVLLKRWLISWLS
jgi:hypothetical protein